MAVLPGVLGCLPLRRTIQVRLGTNALRLPGGTPIFAVSRQQFMKYPGYKALFSYCILNNCKIVGLGRARSMRKAEEKYHLRDVQQMTDRVMIDLFKQKINDMQRSPSHLKGTWSEVDDLLKTHFGKISRIMNQNRDTLLELYKTAIKELEQSPV